MEKKRLGRTLSLQNGVLGESMAASEQSEEPLLTRLRFWAGVPTTRPRGEMLGRVVGAPAQNSNLVNWGLLILLTCCHTPPYDTVLRRQCSEEPLSDWALLVRGNVIVRVTA